MTTPTNPVAALAESLNKRWADKLGLDEFSGFQIEAVLGPDGHPVFQDGLPLLEAVVYGGASAIGTPPQVEAACRHYLLGRKGR